jgi:hypothetical protein
MPRIDDDLLDCVIYLYGSKAEAEAGINIGGSGFLASYPSSMGIDKGGFMYAVTNRHVIRDKCSTVRLNTADGRTDVFEFRQSEWTCSDTDDLAVKVLPGSISGTTYRLRTVSRKMLLSKRLVELFDIGVGDEVAMIGRFINIEGKQQNIPTGRVGHIAQMPLEPIQSEDNGASYDQESFLADIKSIGGYSGSPVFWDIHAAPYFQANSRVQLANTMNERLRIYLLGVDWAHIRDWEQVCSSNGQPLSLGHQVELNTGIAAIIPAWKLADLLDNHPMLKKERDDAEESYFKSKPAETESKSELPFGPAVGDTKPKP